MRAAGGLPRRVDRAALPDTVAVARRAAVRRLLAYAGLLLAGVAGSAVALRGASDHLRAARRVVAEHAAPGAALADPAERRPLSPGALADLQRSWIGSESIAPRQERIDAATGERTRPFQGFGVDVETVPSGARVLVGGEELGTSPLLATVACRPGDEVAVRAVLGAASATARTRCRDGVLVRLSLPLRPAR